MMHIIKSAKVNFMQIAKPLFIVTWRFRHRCGHLRRRRCAAKNCSAWISWAATAPRSASRRKWTWTKSARPWRPSAKKTRKSNIKRTSAGGAETLRVTTSSGSAEKVEQALETPIPAGAFQRRQRSQQVGAVVGSEIRHSAIVASLMAMFGILVYVAFRYEFSFAVGAIVAVLHDVLLTIGCYCIANEISGRQFNATVVAAVLTIIGFSINDKIVIFDRIREDLKLGVRGTFKDIINQALNQTLSRTIITSGTVFLATLSLYIFGGGVINDFAFTFLVGIITGTYSSIYIASAFVLWWHKGQRPNIGASR